MKTILHVNLGRLLSIVLLVTAAAQPFSIQAALPSNFRLRSDNSPLTEDRVFQTLGPDAFIFSKPSGTLWKGTLKRGTEVVVNREEGNGYPTPEFSFPELGDGAYTLNVRITGNPTKTIGFSVRRARPPRIMSQPVSQTVCAGSTVTMGVGATGTEPLRYQWQFDGDDIPGATGAVYSFVADESGIGSYSVTVRNGAGAETSDDADLDVILPPTSSGQPESVEVEEGEEAVLESGIEGEALTFTWSGPGGSIPGESSDTLVIAVTRTTDTGLYTVTGTGRCGAPVTVTIPLSVQPLPLCPEFTVQPANQTARLGATVTFRAAANNAVRWEWYHDDEQVVGATDPVLTLRHVKEGDEGVYYSVAFGADCDEGTYSEEAELEIEAPMEPEFVSELEDQSVELNGSTTLEVEVAGDAPLRFVWKKNGRVITGANGPEVTISQASRADAGEYSVEVSNEAGSIESSALLTVVSPPVITAQPEAVSVRRGELVEFQVEATGDDLSFQWTRDGVPVGDDDSTLFIEAVTAADAGQYQVTVSNIAGEIESRVVRLTVELFEKSNWLGPFYASNGVEIESSGLISSLSMTAQGVFSAKLQRANGAIYSFTGRFNGNSQACARATNRRGGFLEVEMSLGDENLITGHVRSEAEGWEASLTMDRTVWNARTNACPWAGRWAWILPPNDDTAVFQGVGGAPLRISDNGKVSGIGRLANGKPLTVRSVVTAEGNVAVFQPASQTSPSLLGWLNLADDDSLSGLISWIQLPNRQGEGGWEMDLKTFGERFNADKLPFGDLSDGILMVEGNEGEEVEISVQFNGNKITPESGKITVKKDGHFEGSVRLDGDAPIKLYGLVAQSQEAGYGFRSHPDGRSTRVYLGKR